MNAYLYEIQRWAFINIEGMLRSIDLFSGIGGMTLGLHCIAKPILYCDIAPESQAVLLQRMRLDHLPVAPIASDVRKVDGSVLEEVDMITAGFPCVGFSMMGMQKAFEDKDSGLFSEVLRICDSCKVPPPLIFLENVVNVLRLGMVNIIDELSVKRGYEVRWCTVSAEFMGAPHVRNRWFCLAVKPGFAFRWLNDAPFVGYPWTKETMRSLVRTVPASVQTTIRCGLLGNSVVPDAVRYAFLFLSGRNTRRPTGLGLANTVFVPAGQGSAVKFKTLLQRKPNAGIVEAGVSSISKCIEAQGVAKFKEPVVKGPVIDPTSYNSSKPPSPLLKTPFITKTSHMLRWSTPRHSLTGACNYLTERSIRDLPTQVRFEVDTCDRNGTVSAEFIEFLMGFPIGWTCLDDGGGTVVHPTTATDLLESASGLV